MSSSPPEGLLDRFVEVPVDDYPLLELCGEFLPKYGLLAETHGVTLISSGLLDAMLTMEAAPPPDFQASNCDRRGGATAMSGPADVDEERCHAVSRCGRVLTQLVMAVHAVSFTSSSAEQTKDDDPADESTAAVFRRHGAELDSLVAFAAYNCRDATLDKVRAHIKARPRDFVELIEVADACAAFGTTGFVGDGASTGDEELKLRKMGNCKMSFKKRHEVARFCDFVVSKGLRADVIADIGAGQGYLSNALAELHIGSVVGVERDAHQVSGAESRSAALKICHAAVDATTDAAQFFRNVVAAAASPIPHVSEASEQPVRRPAQTGVGVVALHACGSLSQEILRLFAAAQESHHQQHEDERRPESQQREDPPAGAPPAAPPRVPWVVNVGCCYNLLGDPDVAPQARPDLRPLCTARVCDFPMSKVLLQHRDRTTEDERNGQRVTIGSRRCVRLTRNMKMAACQAPRAWLCGGESQLPSSSIFAAPFLRALLQSLAARPLGHSSGTQVDQSSSNRRKRARSADSALELTAETVNATLRAVGGPDRTLTQTDVGAAAARYLLPFAAFWALRAMIGQLVECCLLVDRCVALGECGITRRARLVALFDHRMSPRHVAVYVA